MARKRRIEFPGAFYHVLVRGNNKQKIFIDVHDFESYLDRLRRYKRKYSFNLYAYVLMPNHVHMLLETEIEPLSKIMQGIQQSYTYYFHKKYHTVGHLFQGRYKAILCERESYLLELIRYIHLNPLRSGLEEKLGDYSWSSHHCYLETQNKSLISKECLLRTASIGSFILKSQYIQYLYDGLNKENCQKFKFQTGKDSHILGTFDFVNAIKKDIAHNKEKINKEMGKRSLFSVKRDLAAIMIIVAEKTDVSPESILSRSKEKNISDARSLMAFVSIRHAGHNMAQIAYYLGRELGTISNMIRRIEERLEHDHVIIKTFEEIMKVMKA